MKLTLAQFLEHEARLETAKLLKQGKPKPTKGVEVESDLHDQIITECKQRGWYVVHSRMDRRTTTAQGVPDLIIAASRGRTFWIECKTAKGKLTAEQAGTLHWLGSLGHSRAVVRNLQEFLAATYENHP